MLTCFVKPMKKHKITASGESVSRPSFPLHVLRTYSSRSQSLIIKATESIAIYEELYLI